MNLLGILIRNREMNLRYKVTSLTILTVQCHYEESKMVCVPLIPSYAFTLCSQVASTLPASPCWKGTLLESHVFMLLTSPPVAGAGKHGLRSQWSRCSHGMIYVRESQPVSKSLAWKALLKILSSSGRHFSCLTMVVGKVGWLLWWNGSRVRGSSEARWRNFKPAKGREGTSRAFCLWQEKVKRAMAIMAERLGMGMTSSGPVPLKGEKRNSRLFLTQGTWRDPSSRHRKVPYFFSHSVWFLK